MSTRRRNRNRYPGNPTAAAQQRLVDHLVDLARPPMSRGVAQQILQAANAWTFIALRELDRHLDAHPDALSNPDPHAPRSLVRLAHALIAAGHTGGVVAPSCVVCGQAKPNLARNSGQHPDGLGRCCAVCLTELRVRPCARCREVAQGIARRPDGVICRRCYNEDPERLQPCAGCARVRAPVGRTPAGEPLCASCLPRPEHRCSRCGRVAPTQAITAAGRVCKRCYEAPPRSCGRCGQTRSIVRRASGDLPELCVRCLAALVGCCDFCGRTRRGRIGADRRFRCHGCRPCPVRQCSRCRQRRQAHAFWPRGPVCAVCHDKVLAAPADCHSCGQNQPLTVVQEHRRAQSRTPARTARPARSVRTRDYVCRGCGTAGRTYFEGRCTRCAVTDQVTDLLGDPSGTISAQLLPFADFVLTTSTPQDLLVWLRRSASARLLAQFADSRVPIDHELLDRMPADQELAYLRQLLIAGGVLPQRFEPLASLEPWLDRQLAQRPRSHALLIQPYAQWVVLRRARRDHHRGRYTHMSGQNDRGRLRQTLYLLDWLAAQNRTIGDLTQPLLERWLTEGSARTKREVAPFLAWTDARRITPKLTIARRRSDVPSRFLDEEQHFHLLERCLTDDAMPLAVRAAGALILLYGVRVTTVATLTTTDRFTRPNGAYISLGGTPALLPPNLARLLDQLADQPRRFGDAMSGDS